MGLAALTRKGWKENPRKQGRWNLIVSIVVSVLSQLILFLVGCEDWFDVIFVAPVFLLWGVFSYVLGVIMDRGMKKAEGEEEK